MPTRLKGSTTRAAVVVPTVKRPAKVVVPMPILGPAPVSTKKAGTISVELVAVLVPKAISPQTSKVYRGELVAMPTRLLGSRLMVRRLAMVVVPVKVDEALTMIPTVLVGLIALAPMNCQLEGVMALGFCQLALPLLSLVKT